jgi:hypothetical protein
VGATQVRVDRSGRWLDRLEDVLARLAAIDQEAGATIARPRVLAR